MPVVLGSGRHRAFAIVRPETQFHDQHASDAPGWTLGIGHLTAGRNLRKFGGVAAVGRETALLALGGCRFWGEAERDDGRASVNPDLFVVPTSSIRKVVVESCRWPGRVVG